MIKRFLPFILLSLTLMVMVDVQGQEKLQVVATTSIIADVAQNVGGDLVEVRSIIPREVDVHSYSPSPADVAAISDADVVLVNGAFLEEGLLEIVEQNAASEPVVVSNGVEVLPFDGHDHSEGEEADHEETIGALGIDAICDEAQHEDSQNKEGDEHEHGACDPHFWTNPQNVMIWAQNIADAFAAADPDNAETYQANAAAYVEQLDTLNTELEAMIDTIPEENRILVTNHEFLAYFAHAYHFEVVGTVIASSSTLADVDPATLAALVDVIEAEGVPAIFAEISANSDLAETVAAEVGRDVAVVTLYSDSLSEEDGEAATYIDFMRYNVAQIVSALGGE